MDIDELAPKGRRKKASNVHGFTEILDDVVIADDLASVAPGAISRAAIHGRTKLCTSRGSNELPARQSETKWDFTLKLLLIEDDAETAAYLVGGLTEHGHTVDRANNGRDGMFLASGAYDVIVVDRMLPGMDGLNVVKMMRAAGIKTPVLFLTTMGGINDRVEGLESGGDDYLVKPFAFVELTARLNALARRPPISDAEMVLKVGGLELDRVTRHVSRDGRPIELQPQEYKLLEYLMRNAGRVVTRTMLLEQVWEFHFDPQTNVVETNVSRLRSKVDRGYDVELIQTIRGSGYSLRSPD